MTRLLWSVIPLLFLLILMGILWHRLQTVTQERDKAREQVQTLSSDLTTQNAAIKTWEAQANAQAERLKQAELTNQQQASAYQQQVNQLINQAVPTTCDAAINWGTKEAQQLSKQWK